VSVTANAILAVSCSGRQRDAATGRRGPGGIGHEVREHAQNLAAVGTHRRQIRRRIDTEL